LAFGGALLSEQKMTDSQKLLAEYANDGSDSRTPDIAVVIIARFPAVFTDRGCSDLEPKTVRFF
jgi:hypothetical protein